MMRHHVSGGVVKTHGADLTLDKNMRADLNDAN